jgi:hypothetical protein
VLFNSRIQETVSKFGIQWKNNDTHVRLPPGRLARREKQIRSMHADADDEAFPTISLSHIPETHYNSVHPSQDMSKDGAFAVPEDNEPEDNEPEENESDVSMRDEDDDGKDGNDDDEDDDGEDEDNDDVNQVDSVTPQSPEMGNKSAKRGTDMRPIMGDTPAAETAKKTQSRIVEAKDVTSIASFVDETSGKVKRRRSERRHRSKTDELQSNFFILEGPNGASHAMLPHRRGDAPTWHTYGFYFDSNGLPENPSFEQAFARVENNFPEGWYCAHDINADFVPPTR